MTDNITELIDFQKENSLLEEKLVLEWKINNLAKITEPLRTPIFTWYKEKFCFEVWYKKDQPGTFQGTSSLQVFFKKLLKTSANLNLQFELFITIYYSDSTVYVEHKSAKSLNLAEFTSQTCINTVSRFYTKQNQLTNHGLKVDRSPLIFKCQIHFFGHLVSPSTYHKVNHSLHNLQKISKNFWSLYQSGGFSDVCIQIGEKTLKSHKFLLAVQSPVFKRMLEQDFLETETGVITVSDSKPDVFENFLKFLYTTEIEDKSFANIKQLYMLADKYDVQSLKEECIEILTSCVTEEQIFEILQMAREYNDDMLKTAAKFFLADHFQEEIVNAML